MKPADIADIFGLVVRAVGVFLLYQAVSSFIEYLTTIAALQSFGSFRGFDGAACFKIAGLVAAAVWFLFGAPPVQRLAYPEAKKTSAESIETTGTPCVSCSKPIPVSSQLCPLCGWTQPR
jgi:hypothetical protein